MNAFLNRSGLRKQSPYVLLALLLATLSLSAANDIVVRTKLTPESVWVGQRIVLQIDVLGKDGWAQISDLDDLQIEGCYVLPAGNTRGRLQETIEGADYSGQRYELSIYPQRSSTLEFPELALNIKVQTWGTTSGTHEQVATTELTSIEAKLPTSVTNAQSFIAAPSFTATQTWSTDTNAVTVGDSLKRTIQLVATDLPSMVLPPIAAADIEHLSVYPDTPELSDTSDDSTPTAQRTETITYLFEENGNVTLPTYSFQWWNPETEELKTISLDGKQLQITGGAVTPPSGDPVADSQNTVWLFSLIIILPAIGYVVVSHYQSNRPDASKEQTEHLLFKELQMTAAANRTPPFLQKTMTWITTLTNGTDSTSEFLSTYADSTTQEQFAILLRDPAAPQTTVSPKSLIKGLQSARANYFKARKQVSAQQQAEACLPTLNA